MTKSREEHRNALRKYLNEWTPLDSEDRQRARTDAPGVLFIDGEYYESLPFVECSVSLSSDDSNKFEFVLEAVRNTQKVHIMRGGEVIHELSRNNIGESFQLKRYNDPQSYEVKAKSNDSWRKVATVGTERFPDKPLPDGRYYGAVVLHGGKEEEKLGREVVAKCRYDAVESWTHARYVVVAESNQKEIIPDEILYEPTEQEYDVWFNAFYTDYTDIGDTVLRSVLWPDSYAPVNKPYCIICTS